MWILGCAAAFAGHGGGVWDLREEALDRYRAEDWGAFVALMERVVVETGHPNDVYNLGCGYALSGQPARALGVLATVATGDFAEDLRTDDDLDSLRGLPTFARVVERASVSEAVEERLGPWRDRAWALYREGRYDRYLVLQEEIVAESDDGVDLYNLACGYALAGRADSALTTLRLLAERGASFDPAKDSDFAALRSDPRFTEVAARFSTG